MIKMYDAVGEYRRYLDERARTPILQRRVFDFETPIIDQLRTAMYEEWYAVNRWAQMMSKVNGT